MNSMPPKTYTPQPVSTVATNAELEAVMRRGLQHLNQLINSYNALLKVVCTIQNLSTTLASWQGSANLIQAGALVSTSLTTGDIEASEISGGSLQIVQESANPTIVLQKGNDTAAIAFDGEAIGIASLETTSLTTTELVVNGGDVQSLASVGTLAVGSNPESCDFIESTTDLSVVSNGTLAVGGLNCLSLQSNVEISGVIGSETPTEVFSASVTAEGPYFKVFGYTETQKLRVTSDANLGANLYMPHDGTSIYMGADNDALIQYNGTNLVINPKRVGSGKVVVSGSIQAEGTALSREGWASYDIYGYDSALRFYDYDGTARWSLGKYNATSSLRLTNGSSLSASPLIFEILADGHVRIPGDNKYIYLGAENDAAIYYSGTDLHINPKAAGSGGLIISGTIQADGYIASSGDPGITVDTGGLSFVDGLLVGGEIEPGGSVDNVIGTENQVIITPSGDDIQLSTPQDIDTGADVQFATMYLSGGLTSKGFSYMRDASDNNTIFFAPSSGTIFAKQFYVRTSPTNPATTLAYINDTGIVYAVGLVSTGATGLLIQDGSTLKGGWSNSGILYTNQINSFSTGTVAVTGDIAVTGKITCGQLVLPVV